MWSETRRSLRSDSAGFIFKVYIKLKTLIGASLFKTHIYIYFEKNIRIHPGCFPGENLELSSKNIFIYFKSYCFSHVLNRQTESGAAAAEDLHEPNACRKTYITIILYVYDSEINITNKTKVCSTNRCVHSDDKCSNVIISDLLTEITSFSQKCPSTEKPDESSTETRHRVLTVFKPSFCGTY